MEAPARIDYTNQKVIKTLQATVAKGASPEEFEMFTAFCQSTGLNPFKREIWFIKDKTGRVQMMTGINGFYEIANKHPQFDNIETEIVEEKGKIIKAVAKVYRKDRSRPMTAEAYFSEYAKEYGNWKSMPRVMLSKCAESMALRKSFPQELNGLYTAEEMPPDFQPPVAQVLPKNGTPTPTPQPEPEPEDDLPEGFGQDVADKIEANRAQTAAEAPQLEYVYDVESHVKDGELTQGAVNAMFKHIKREHGVTRDVGVAPQLWRSPVEIAGMKPYLFEMVPV